MKNKASKQYILLDAINGIIGFVFLLSIIIICFPIFLNPLILSSTSYIIILIPLMCLTIPSIYCLSDKIPTESLVRLILIDIIIFVLYLISFLMVMFALIDRTNMIFYYVMALVYFCYFFLTIPLIGVIIVTIYYLKVNMPIETKKLSIFLGLLTLIIVLFFALYLFLNWSIPFLEPYYQMTID